jgi:hypothetical protein
MYKLYKNFLLNITTGGCIPISVDNLDYKNAFKHLNSLGLATSSHEDGFSNPVFSPDGVMLLAEAVPTLDELKAAAHNEIDVAAGNSRMKYITVVPGQEATYLEKAKDAEKFIADGLPADLTPYPWLKAEKEAIGGETSAQFIAEGILTQRAQWAVVGSAIEKERRSGKIKVTAATTAEDVDFQKAIAISNLMAL